MPRLQAGPSPRSDPTWPEEGTGRTQEVFQEEFPRRDLRILGFAFAGPPQRQAFCWEAEFGIGLRLAVCRGEREDCRDPITPVGLARTVNEVDLSGLRVLLVEDDQSSQSVLRILLTERGMVVVSVGTGREALEELERGAFDLLILDIGLPDENGYSLLRRVRSLPQPSSAIPAIAVTGFTTQADRQRARDTGFQAHVGKPIDHPGFLQTIAGLFREKRSDRPEARDSCGLA
jgi:CheY-like chemotaxis protein